MPNVFIPNIRMTFLVIAVSKELFFGPKERFWGNVLKLPWLSANNLSNVKNLDDDL